MDALQQELPVLTPDQVQQVAVHARHLADQNRAAMFMERCADQFDEAMIRRELAKVGADVRVLQGAFTRSRRSDDHNAQKIDARCKTFVENVLMPELERVFTNPCKVQDNDMDNPEGHWWYKPTSRTKVVHRLFVNFMDQGFDKYFRDEHSGLNYRRIVDFTGLSVDDEYVTKQ